MAEIQNGSVVITGLSEFEAKLKQLKTDNPGFERRLRSVIRKIMGEVRSTLSKEARQGLDMNSDPRHSYKAVRYAVYRKLFGGNVNILQSRKAGAESAYERPRTLVPGQRGGNRRLRVSRNLDKYEGKDRGFILRFLNQGTEPRYNGGRNGRTQEQRQAFILANDSRYYRGKIAPRKWFGSASQRALENAAGRIHAIIDRVVNDEFM